MPPYNMLAGALSRAIGEGFTGATQGLVQGEDIRQKRALEELQRQQLQLQQQMAPIQQRYYESLIRRHQQPQLFQYGPNVGAVDPRTQRFQALGQFPQSPQQVQEGQLREFEISAAREAEAAWPMWQHEFRSMAADPRLSPDERRVMALAATNRALGLPLAVEWTKGIMRQRAGGDIFKTTTPSVRQELIHGMGLRDPSKWTAQDYTKAQKTVGGREMEKVSGAAAVRGATNRTVQMINKLGDAERLLDDADRLIGRMQEGIQRLARERPDAARLFALPYVEFKRWLAGNKDPMLNILTEYETFDAQFAIFARAFDKITGARIPIAEALWARGFHPKPEEPISAQLTRLGQARRVAREGRLDLRKQANDAITRYKMVLEGVGATPYLAPFGEGVGGAAPGGGDEEGFVDE